MGDVYVAVDATTGQRVAIKLLRPMASDGNQARFAREIAVLADLRHPSIVHYIAHGVWEDGRQYYAMEWLDGEDLSQRQRHAPLGMRDAVEVVRRASAAMAAVHARNVVHRDLKLSNIFLVRGKGTAVKLIDFGVVKPATDDDHQTGHGQIVGTPHFMAPEQARGDAIDARADVYSLGAVLYRLVTGRNIFDTDPIVALLSRLVLEDPPNPANVRFDLPETLAEVMVRAIARDREARYENGGELARALARVGPLNNDPPSGERSGSAIRRTVPEPSPGSGGIEPKPPSRRGLGERRLVAVLLVDLAGCSWSVETEARVRTEVGDDVRFERRDDGCLVTMFGPEGSESADVLRATRAAFVIRRVLTNDAWISPTTGEGVDSTPRGGPRFAIGVGVAPWVRPSQTSGVLDRAARQLDQTPPGGVRVDGCAIHAIAGHVALKEMGDGALVLGEDRAGFAARRLAGRKTPTVGRDKELALLCGLYDDIVRGGPPNGAIVQGGPGVGKSRLCIELRRQLDRSPQRAEILSCRGELLGSSESTPALGYAIRALMGVQARESSVEQVAKVENHVTARVPRSLRFLAAFLGELAGIRFPDDADQPLRAARQSPQLMQTRIRTALEAFIRAQAAPLVLLIDDLHNVDEMTVNLVEWLLGSNLPLSVFAFARPEVQKRYPNLWESRLVTRFTLAPLSPLAARRLVTTALPTVDGSLCSSIIARSGGNPFFLEELVRCVASGESELPLTIQAVVRRGSTAYP